MARTLIQEHTSRIIEGFLKEADALGDLHNTTIKGTLRELFCGNLINRFLPTHFELGSGCVINHRGIQSNQSDIIIYDNRAIPPFIKEEKLGVSLLKVFWQL
jgi:hypothetical protein